jgi:hypothetical protein
MESEADPCVVSKSLGDTEKALQSAVNKAKCDCEQSPAAKALADDASKTLKDFQQARADKALQGASDAVKAAEMLEFEVNCLPSKPPEPCAAPAPCGCGPGSGYRPTGCTCR